MMVINIHCTLNKFWYGQKSTKCTLPYWFPSSHAWGHVASWQRLEDVDFSRIGLCRDIIDCCLRKSHIMKIVAVNVKSCEKKSKSMSWFDQTHELCRFLKNYWRDWIEPGSIFISLNFIFALAGTVVSLFSWFYFIFLL